MAKIDTLFPILDSRPPHLVRAAQHAPLDSIGCLTEYRPIDTKSIVGKSSSRRGMPFSHSINPYRGCEFACRYCYARYTHEFLELRRPEDFERKIFFKQNAAWLLSQELDRLKRGTQIALGTATDPYQPIERRQRITRSLLEVFSRKHGFNLGIITKSTLIARDIDLLEQVAASNQLTVHVTITTADAKLARLLEPRAPRPDLRFRTVARLRQAGLRVGVMCAPLMPGINDSRSSIAAVARAAAASGASFLGAGTLFLKPCSQPTFLSFVREHFPSQLADYERRYATNAFVSPAYRKRIAELVDAICREHKLGRRYDDSPLAGDGSQINTQTVELQPWLPFAPVSAS